ncbi:M20 family metallo-hydrolase [Pararhodobacter sp. SW119]|uniref:M20 family metallo-hydrolase n=1 Tax=Pararhodobacter sp. SW119 TaxID=2780075 RepID=UPI001ADF6984|nr:M20 family metallo-hydrolase [Pararhodobacter sp. SW119]
MNETAEFGRAAVDWIDRLAAVSEPGPGVTRMPFSDEHRRVLPLVQEMMEDAGLSVSMDAAGTLIGRRKGPAGAPVLLLGSHQDSVRQGGAYDGAMGVVLPALALKAIRGEELPFAIELLCFADEEGARFPTALMGPRALAGTFDMASLELKDPDGISLRRAMTDFGLEPEELPGLKRDPAGIIGWIECHIEQGPVLEAEGEALGVVTAICGIERHAVRLTGQAAHAGTVPMALRRDTLAGAAELVAAVEARARGTDGLLATVGALRVQPGVVNAVPGAVDMTVEIRAPEDAVREAAGTALTDAARRIADARGLEVEMTRTYAQAATPCDAGLQDALEAAIRASGGEGRRLASGATHDSSAMADLCPVAMMFLACRDGVSHNPAEYCPPEVMGQAVAAYTTLLSRMGAEGR